jgi:hypothetical protein
LPEHPEVETDKLSETIQEKLEERGGAFLRNLALTTAIFAAVAAVAALQAGHTVNEALALKMDAARLETSASDQWAFYQAKGIKGAVAQASAGTWQALGKTPPPGLEASAKRYAVEQDSIREQAKEFEHQRDEASHEADGLLRRHAFFANAVALLQVAIALGAVAALTRIRMVWVLSMLVGAAGLAFFLWPFAGR